MIKKTVGFLFLLAMVIVFSCNEKTVSKVGTKTIVANGEFPIMTFLTKEHDFGAIEQGDKVAVLFRFTNTGKANLVINNVFTSCGCTIPEYPKEPIKPGESSKIKVLFNSAGKHGLQLKTITITTNTANKSEKLVIKSLINSKPGTHFGITSH